LAPQLQRPRAFFREAWRVSRARRNALEAAGNVLDLARAPHFPEAGPGEAVRVGRFSGFTEKCLAQNTPARSTGVT
jgi:hypothetical protein